MDQNKKQFHVKKKLGGVLGMFTALTLAVTAVPMEVQAYTDCGFRTTGCSGYTQDVGHNHSVQADKVTVKKGTFYNSVTLTNSQIEGGTFDKGVTLGKGTTVTGGDFSRTVVTISGSVNITGGEFGNVTVINDAWEPKISGITISGSLTVNIKKNSNMIFDSCIFEGPVTIKGNTTGGTVTFNNCTANGSVTIESSVKTGMVTFKESKMNGSVENYGAATTMNDCRLLYEPNGSHGITMDEKTTIKYRNVTASDSGTGHDNTYDNNAHTCDYEWVTVREAGPGVDGEECYRCKECGRVEAIQTIPATAYLTRELYDQIGVVGENGTVTYEFEDFHTISDRLLTTLQERKDVTLVITFTYQNRQYQTTFPAGSDYTELFEDEEMFYGLLGISGRCGIVTVEVPTGEAPAAAPAA